jgi:hypothetical protein
MVPAKFQRNSLVFSRFLFPHQLSFFSLSLSLFSLGFCVDRHDEITRFEPRPYWVLVPSAVRNGRAIKFKWLKGKIFDPKEGERLQKSLLAAKTAK